MTSTKKKQINKRRNIITSIILCGTLFLQAGAVTIMSLPNLFRSADAAVENTLTFDFTKNPGGWPTANSTTLTNYTYKLKEVDYTFALKNIKCNSGYIMATQPSVLGLPAIQGNKLTKVIAKNTGSCSTAVKVGISTSDSSESYVAGGEAQTWSTTSSSYTYTLSETADNTVYYLYVTNKNAQITSLELTYESTAAYSVNFDANGGSRIQKGLSGDSPTFTLPETTTFLPPEEKDFDGWGTTKTGGRISGSTYTIPSGQKEVTLYALWKDVSYINLPEGDYSVTFNATTDTEIPDGYYPIKADEGTTRYKPLVIKSTECTLNKSYNEFVYKKSSGKLEVHTNSNAIITNVSFDFYQSIAGTMYVGEKEVTPISGGIAPTSTGNKYYFPINSSEFEFVVGSEHDSGIYSFVVELSVAGVSKVEQAISAIGTVEYTQDSYNLIITARGAFDALSLEDQAKVTNRQVLFDAEDKFDELKDTEVQKVEGLINAIGTVDLNSGEKIKAARKAYNALLNGEIGKDCVSNIETLEAAETTYADLTAADNVCKLIEALPDPSTIVDYTHHDQISAARKAYDKLSDFAKTKVPSELLNKLVACENAENEYGATFYYNGNTINMSGENDAALLNADASKWSIVGKKGGHNLLPGLNADGSIHLYGHKDGGNSIEIKGIGKNMTILSLSIKLYSTSPSQALVVKIGDEELTPEEDGTYTIDGTEVVIENVDQEAKQIYIGSITATYNDKVYSAITYHNVDGIDNSNNPTTYIEGKGASLEAPQGTKEGHTFAGWYDNESFSGDPITSISNSQEGDVELYAKWEVNKHTVTFFGEDGVSIYEKRDNVAYGSKLDLPAVEPYKAKYTFKGWSKTLGGEVVWKDGQYSMPDEDLDFYPIFSINPVQDVVISGSFTSIEATDTNKLLKATITVAEGKTLTTDEISWTISDPTAGSFAKPTTRSGESPEFVASNSILTGVTITATSVEDPSVSVSFTFDIVIPGDEYLASIEIIKGEDAKTTYLDTDEEVDTTDLTVDGTYKSTRLPNYQNVRDVTDSVTWTLDKQNKKVVAEFDNKVDSFDVKIVRTVEHIEVLQNPTKVEYFEQDDFKADGLIIRVYYHIGDVETVTYNEETKDSFSFDVVTFRSYLTEKVTLTYESGTAEIPVTVYKNEAVNAEFYRGPAKVSYYEGECFDPSYITYKVEFTNGAIRYIKYANDTAIYFDYDDEPLTLGTDNMHVKFIIDELICEDDFPITVNEVLPVKIEVEPSKVVLNYNTDISSVDITAYVYKNNGTREVVNFEDLAFTGYDKTVPGRYEVTVSYLTFTTKILVVVDQSYEVDYIEAKSLVNEFAYNEEFNSELVYVDIIYTDGHRLRNVIPDEVLGYDKTKVGEQTLTVKLDDKETTIKVTVKESTVIDHIEATTAKTTLAYGEELTLNDFDVTIYYTDGRKVEHQAPTYIFGYNKTVIGKQNVKVRVNNSFTYVEVSVNESTEIDHIEAVSLKPNVSYEYEFSVNDVSLTVVYKDGRRVDYQKPDSFSGYNKTKIGKQTLTVKYQEKETTIEVNVKESKEVTNAVATCAKTELAKGDALSKDDVTFTLTYADGHTESAKATYLAGYDANKVGEQKVTVAYKGLVKIIIIIVADK